MEITPRFTSCFNRTIHQLDRRGFIRDWLISEAWIARADDLDQVLASTGNPFGKDGRWVLTNGPDIAELKAKLFPVLPAASNNLIPFTNATDEQLTLRTDWIGKH